MRGDLNAFGQLVAGAVISALGLGVLLWRVVIGAHWTFMDCLFVVLCFWGGIASIFFGVMRLSAPEQGAGTEQNNDTEQKRLSPPWGFIAVCISFCILAIVGSVIEVVRYYSSGVGDDPPVLTLIVASLLLALILWNWFPQRRHGPLS